MKTIGLMLILLLPLQLFGKAVFDYDKANEEKEQFIQKLKEAHREQIIQSFEHELQHQQKKLQLALKFIDDLTQNLSGVSLEKRRDFNKLLKDYRNRVKDFEKTVKRRDKFFEKDLMKPKSKDFDKKLKSLISTAKTQSRDWIVREEKK